MIGTADGPKQDFASLVCYTREPLDDMIYSKRLAYSLHLALSFDGESYFPLNHNSGVLFARATENSDGTLNAKSLKSPCLFSLADGSFGVLAIRTAADGEDDAESRGKALFFHTEDFIRYTEVGLIDLCAKGFVAEVGCRYEATPRRYVIEWRYQAGEWQQSYTKDLFSLKTARGMALEIEKNEIRPECGVEGAVAGNALLIPRAKAERLWDRLTVPRNIEVEVPRCVWTMSSADLANTKATLTYSNGAQYAREVYWDASEIDWEKPGKYEVTGYVGEDFFGFPLIENRADPHIFKWKGLYYFIATNDADGNQSLSVRESESVFSLMNEPEKVILDTNTYPHVGNLLWAPEFHEIKGELYLFFACSPKDFEAEEAHVMRLRPGFKPNDRKGWDEPRRVIKKDGSFLCEAGKCISLDMTCFAVRGEHYAVWSQRQLSPVDLGAWLYIARLNPQEPWRLDSDPVALTKPVYGWTNNHAFVDEGPFAIQRGGRIFLTISSALVDTTYSVGLLTAKDDANLLDPANWERCPYPILTSRSAEGQYGPGHNSYVIDENGIMWNVYHARPKPDGPRCIGLRRVHFDAEGYPVLDLYGKNALDPNLRKVKTLLVIGS
jgi:GH43 family beta-xylosidase